MISVSHRSLMEQVITTGSSKRLMRRPAGGTSTPLSEHSMSWFSRFNLVSSFLALVTHGRTLRW